MNHFLLKRCLTAVLWLVLTGTSALGLAASTAPAASALTPGAVATPTATGSSVPAAHPPATTPAATAPTGTATPTTPPAAGAPAAASVNSIQMMDAFDKNQAEKDDGVTPLNDHTKKLTMFLLGVPLLILVLCTGAVGIAMGVFGKPWFVAHMILAGLSMTLALVHAIVGIAWFYPF